MIIIVGTVPSHIPIETIRNLEKKTIEYTVSKYNAANSREVQPDMLVEDVQILVSFNTTAKKAHVTIYATKRLGHAFLKRFVDIWAQHLQAEVTGMIYKLEKNDTWSAKSGF